MRIFAVLFVVFCTLGFVAKSDAWQLNPTENISIWPGLAPGETSEETGTKLPPREKDTPTITRVENIRKPTIDVLSLIHI